MADFLDILGLDAKKTITEGYYEVAERNTVKFISLKKAILEAKGIPIIAEIKVASPSTGIIKEKADVENIAGGIESGGAVGISVVTEPKHFQGSLESFVKVRRKVKLPLLMKDIVVASLQLDAASKMGANAILLIQSLFDRGYCKHEVQEMISYAHSRDLEVLLEVHNENEFKSAIQTDADLIGINNRNLGTLEVNLETTKKIMNALDSKGKIVVSESGIKTRSDIEFLRDQGVRAFLIGSSIMLSNNIKRSVREFTTVHQTGTE